MARFGDILTLVMKTRGMNSKQLAEKSGVHVNTVRRALKLDTPDLRKETIDMLALPLGYSSADDLLGSWATTVAMPQPVGAIDRGMMEVIQKQSKPPARPVPILNRTAAGEPRTFYDPGYQGIQDDERSSYSELPILTDAVGDEQAFALIVDGDSMSPSFAQGDVAVFAPRAMVEDGDICLIQFTEARDEAQTIKRVRDLGDGTVQLIPDNPKHKVLTVNATHDAGEVIRIVKCVGRYELFPWVPNPEDRL